MESVVLILPSAVWASVERQSRPREDQPVNGAVSIGIVSPGETIHVWAWTDSVPTANTARSVRLRHLSGYAPVSYQGAGYRLISAWAAVLSSDVAVAPRAASRIRSVGEPTNLRTKLDQKIAYARG